MTNRLTRERPMLLMDNEATASVLEMPAVVGVLEQAYRALPRER
jgi:hypothetical protein